MSSGILKNTGPTTITWTWGVNGTATDVGAVTVTITDGNGTAVATDASTTNNTDGTYTYVLAVQPDVTELAFAWTDGTSTQYGRIPVVGGWLFTEAQARAFDLATLGSETTYPDKDIASMRQQITADLETWTRRSWVPKYCRYELPGTGTYTIDLRDAYTRLADGTQLQTPGAERDINKIVTATASGTTITPSNIKILRGKLLRTDAAWTNPTRSDPLNVIIEAEYGREPHTDGSDRIGMLLLRDRLVASNISDRASSFSDELGNYQFVTPGVRGAVSNIPEVNRWVMDHTMNLPVF